MACPAMGCPRITNYQVPPFLIILKQSFTFGYPWITVFNTEAKPYSHYIQLHRIPVCHIVAALPKLSSLACFTRMLVWLNMQW